jgi:hypothetical protein
MITDNARYLETVHKIDVLGAIYTRTIARARAEETPRLRIDAGLADRSA